MNDKDKQIDILRSEASRIGYHGLPLDTFMKKAGGDIVLSLKTKIDDINAKGNATNKEYKLLEKSKIKLKKKIASLNVRWHDIGSLLSYIYEHKEISTNGGFFYKSKEFIRMLQFFSKFYYYHEN